MALPRWILSEWVDSVAMLQAYNEWRHKNPAMAKELGLDKGLPTINHCPELDSPDMCMNNVMEIPCPRGDNCWRCRERRPGYTFRWFSCLWLEEYKSWRRDCTWLPGDAEGYRETRIEDCRGEIVSSRGHLVVGVIDEVMDLTEFIEPEFRPCTCGR